MRTKTIERKRYSLRVPKRRDTTEILKSPSTQSPRPKKQKIKIKEDTPPTEEEKESNLLQEITALKKVSVKSTPEAVKRHDVREYQDLQKDVLEAKSQSTSMVHTSEKEQLKSIEKPAAKIQKTKRKGKPSKSATKEDNDYSTNILECSTNTKDDLNQLSQPSQQEVHEGSTNSSPPVEKKPTDEIRLEDVSATNSEEEFPVYSALKHAITCDTEENTCAFPKCSIAKQFLAHSEACPKKDNCTICKAMDIMVCKHAENCETPLEKSCPIPNCDRVRYMVLEEWVKLKHRHHDIMTQVFQGLLHAWKCGDKSCDSILCENIKTVLLHTQSCPKDEKRCRTKKFVVQLCEYHQQTCLDQQCSVEFCQENRKRKAEVPRKKNELNSMEYGQDDEENSTTEGTGSYASGAVKPLQNFTSNNLYFPNIQGNGVLPAGAIVPPWNTLGFFPQTAANMYPGNQIAYTFPYMAWQPFNAAGYEINPFPQDQHSPTPSNVKDNKEEHEEATWPQDVNNEHESVNVVEESTSCLPNSQEAATADTVNFRTIPEIQDVDGNRYPLPMEEMYYQLWPNTKENNVSKASLPRLSPNELQTILLSRDADNMQQMLSPVQNNRAQFSEAPILINEYQASQESELDENPIISMDSAPQHDQVAHFIAQEKRIEEMENNLKDQESWSKIDFLKEQNLHQGFDVDTETADETENESVTESIYSNIQDEACFLKERNEKTECLAEDDEDKEKSEEKVRENSSMTTIERSYLTILQGQRRDQI